VIKSRPPIDKTTRKKIATFRKDCRAQVLPIAAVLMPTLLAFMGLSLDVGYMYHIKRRMQTGADAGAMGGARELWRMNPVSEAKEAGQNDAKLNGFDDADSDVEVTVNIPPLSGPRSGDSNFVEVIIREEIPTFFMRVIQRNLVVIRARSVAGLLPGADGCVMALNPTVRGALTLNGGGGGPSGLIADCGVLVNSNHRSALTLNGSGVTLQTNAIGVTGGIANPSGAPLSPDPVTGMPPALDPLAYLDTPTVPAACDFWDTVVDSSTVVTLTPGRYCANPVEVGGVVTYPASIEISGSANVTFAPGIYILDSGIKVTGDTTVIGTAVTFYSTNTLYPGELSAWNDFDFAGTSHVELTASQSGDYAGILFWVDPAMPAGITPGSVIAGDSTSSFEGAIYSPSGHVAWRGTGTTADWTMIVADTVEVSGNAYLAGGFDSSNVPLPTRKATMVE